MSKENRFEGLMGVVGKNKKAQTSKNSDVQKSSSKKNTASKSNNKSSKSLNAEVFEQPDIQTSIISAGERDRDIQEPKKLDVQTSKSSKTQTSKKAKSVDPDYTRTTIYLPKKMHKKLKAIAVEEEKEMSGIVEELIAGWLNSASSAR